MSRTLRFLISAACVSSLMACGVPVGPNGSGMEPGPMPSMEPSTMPSVMPSMEPSATPSAMPSMEPSAMPSMESSAAPTQTPTNVATVYALTSSGNALLRFTSDLLALPTRMMVTGLGSDEKLLGIDFRPVDKMLYGVTSAQRLVTINLENGAVTAIGSTPLDPMVTMPMGFDFNPMADRLRVHGMNGQNLRLNQLTGAVAATDGTLTYASGDAGAGNVPMLTGTAYTNSVPGATSTDLFAIDHARDTLVRLNAPNDGVVTTVGALGVNAEAEIGFDIAPDGLALATLRVGDMTSLYRIDLNTGAATMVGNMKEDVMTNVTEGINGLAIMLP